MRLLATFRKFAESHLIADTPSLPPDIRNKAALGVCLGIAGTGALLLAAPAQSLFLVGAIGATSVMLFALPHSPMAQPWSVFGGYLVAALCALAAARVIPHPLLAAALAIGAALWLMIRLNCLHPPGGAVVLLVCSEAQGDWPHLAHLLGVVSCNVILILACAWLVHNGLLRQRYPQCRMPEPRRRHGTRDLPPAGRIGLTHDDIDHALRHMDTFVDIQETELERIYELALQHAFERHIAVSCGDVMARDIVSVEFGTELDEAWSLLRKHHLRALPVIDCFRRVVGIVTISDFLREFEKFGKFDSGTATGAALRAMLRRTPGNASPKVEVVGQIMSPEVTVARIDTPLSELVPKLFAAGLHHVPVVDDRKCLAGMISQSDLIAALHHRLALASP